MSECYIYLDKITVSMYFSLNVVSKPRQCIGMLYRLRAGQLRNLSSVPCRNKRFFSLVKSVQTDSGSQPVSYSVPSEDVSPRRKRPVRGADYFNLVLRLRMRYASTPSISLNVLQFFYPALLTKHGRRDFRY
jgi:hypothetical protein